MPVRYIVGGVILFILFVIGAVFILKVGHESAEDTPPIVPPSGAGPAVVGGPFAYDGWEAQKANPDTYQFLYPSPFPADYMTPTEWPPQVDLVESTYSCTSSNTGTMSQTSERTINNEQYCVMTKPEGTAGSVYTSYTYITRYDDQHTVRLSFTLRKIQCGVYDELERSRCTIEQEELDPDILAWKIIESITVSQN